MLFQKNPPIFLHDLPLLYAGCPCDPGDYLFFLIKKKFREGGLGWGTHVNPWLIHVNVWQKPLQYCKVISLQLIKINEKKFIYLAVPGLL